jgi:L-arabinose isomerase
MNFRTPKIGLLLLTAKWFSQIGATQGTFSSLSTTLQADAQRICSTLSPDMDLVCPGILSTPDQVASAINQFQQENVDGVIICYLTWGEDRTVLEAVDRLGNLPFLLWCYLPLPSLPDPLSMPEMLRMSGPVAALQASGPLKRLGKKYAIAFGTPGNPPCHQQLTAFARASRIAHDLKRAVIGVLPYRCDQMTGTYVDEFRLRQELGPSLKYISTSDYRILCEAIPAEQVQAFVHQLKASYPLSPDLTDLGLLRGARVSLGLAELVKQHALDAIAIEDVGEELHRMLGLRPCLSVPELFERAVVSMEAEIGGAVALLILRHLTDQPVMYTETFTADVADNCLLLGHAGIQDARLAASPQEILLEPDGEYRESEPDSAWMSLRIKGGQITLLSVFCDVERFKFIIASGEALPGPRRLLGSPHALVHLTTPLSDFFTQALRTGMTQHFALVHAQVIDELLILADILGVDVVTIG